MTLQQYLSILPRLLLPSGNLQTPFLSIPWCYLPISSFVFLSFFLLSLSPAELSWPCPRIFRCGHTIWVSVSLPWLGDHHALQLHSGFCCEPPCLSHGLCRKCSEVSYSISSQGLGSFSLFLRSRSSSQRHKRKVDKMSIRISLTLEASKMFLFLHMIFSLQRAAVVWAILERISGFDPALEMIAPRYLKFSTSSRLWLFILISLWKPFWVVCHHFCLVWTYLHFVPCGGCIETVNQDAHFFFLFCIYDNVICKAEVGNKSSSDADTTFMVIQCLTHDSL